MGNSENCGYYDGTLFSNWLSICHTITIVDRKYRSILLLLATIPFWINFLVRSYAWIVILRSQGLVNTLLLKLGIISEPLNLLYNTPSVILGMVYSLLPFMILPAAY